MGAVRKRPKIAENVQGLLTFAREQRGGDEMSSLVGEMFGISIEGLTLKDLDDWQLLQALFIESQWALGQQAKEMAMTRQVAGLNRAQRRNHARRR